MSCEIAVMRSWYERFADLLSDECMSVWTVGSRDSLQSTRSESEAIVMFL